MYNCEFFYDEKQLSSLRIDDYVAGVKNAPMCRLWLAPEVCRLRVNKHNELRWWLKNKKKEIGAGFVSITKGFVG